MALFRSATRRAALSPRLAAENTYNTARANLLLVILFTVINICMLLFGSGSYFLFSAAVPYNMVLVGVLLCGRFEGAEEYFLEIGTEPLPSIVLVVLSVLAFIVLAIYLVCFLFCGKHRVGWMITALVFFGIDTLGMLVMDGISIDSLMDILFHIWVLYYLIAGVTAHDKLKKMPPDEEPDLAAATDAAIVDPAPEAAETNVWDTLNAEIEQSTEDQEKPEE